jgi:hydroxymethylpyrimidine pyrophosphatase-like HAD family hydrolase
MAAFWRVGQTAQVVLASEIRAVITDLDGTIVRADGTVSPATHAAVVQLQEAEIPLIAATARTPAGLSVLGSLADQLAGAICCNGSLGWVPGPRATLWRDVLDPRITRAVADVLARTLPDAAVGVYDGREWAVTPTYFAARGKWPTGPRRITTLQRIAGTDACAMGICHPWLPSASLAGRLSDAGISPDRASVSYGAPDVLDIAPPGIDKGTGVTRLLAQLGISASQAIGFGDAPNDLPMFGHLGIAVAVANAHPDVIAAADIITAAVDDDGFARILREAGIIKG